MPLLWSSWCGMPAQQSHPAACRRHAKSTAPCLFHQDPQVSSGCQKSSCQMSLVPCLMPLMMYQPHLHPPCHLNRHRPISDVRGVTLARLSCTQCCGMLCSQDESACACSRFCSCSVKRASHSFCRSSRACAQRARDRTPLIQKAVHFFIQNLFCIDSGYTVKSIPHTCSTLSAAGEPGNPLTPIRVPRRPCAPACLAL